MVTPSNDAVRRIQVRLGAFAVAAGTLLVLLATPRARAQEVSYSGSLQVATGKYLFTERTNTASLLNGLTVRAGRFQVSASIPLLYQSTPFVSYTPGGGVPTGGPEQRMVNDSLQRRGGGSGPMGMGAARAADLAAAGRGIAGAATILPRFQVTASEAVTLPDTASFDQVGFGDPSVRVSVDLTSPDRTDLTVTLSGEVKAPLADPTRGFGTGEWDGGGALSVGGRVGSTLLFGEVGYWILGDMPDLPLKNPVSYSVGLGHALADGRVGLLATLSGYSRILEGTEPPLDVGGGVSYRLAPGQSLSLGVSIGLSESSPDVSVAAGWRTGL